MSVNESDFDRVYHSVFGNGDTGLDEQVKDLNRAVFRDERTGQAGLVPRMDRLEKAVWLAIALLLALLFGLDTVLKGLVGL